LVIIPLQPANDKTAGDRKDNANENNRPKIRQVENTSKSKSAFLEKDQREARVGSIVGAGIGPKDGRQATVREEMRGEKIRQQEEQESDQASVEKGAGYGRIKIISLSMQ